MDTLFGNIFNNDVAVEAVPALDLSSKQEGSSGSKFGQRTTNDDVGQL